VVPGNWFNPGSRAEGIDDWQPVQPVADRRHSTGILLGGCETRADRPGPLDEELDGRRGRQRVERNRRPARQRREELECRDRVALLVGDAR
jgi:hypothetical protein